MLSFRGFPPCIDTQRRRCIDTGNNFNLVRTIPVLRSGDDDMDPFFLLLTLYVPLLGGLFYYALRSRRVNVALQTTQAAHARLTECLHTQEITLQENQHFIRQTKEVLREHDERYRNLFEHTSEALTTLTTSGIITEVNRTSERLSGWSRQELLGKHFSLLMPPPSATLAEERQRRALAGEEVSPTFELEIVHKDGHLIPIEARVRFVYNKASKVIGFQCSYRDIIERKQAAQALRESEDRWQLAVRGSNDGIWDWNVKANTVFYSARWKEMFGFDDDDVVDTFEHFTTQLHPEDRGRVLHDLHEHFEQHTPFFASEFRIQPKDGPYRWHFARGQALWDEADQVVRMAGISSDITDRKKLEEAVRASEERFRSLSVSSPVGIFQTDGTGACVYTNPRWQELSGLSEEACLGFGWVNGVAKSERQALLDAWSAHIKAGKDFSEEFCFVHPNGEERWVHSRSARIHSENGTLIGFVGTTEDITERKQAEAEREALNTRMIEVSRQVGMAEVATHVLHNVGNVLNSINVATVMLEQTLRQSRLSNVSRLGVIFERHADDLSQYLSQDPKGRQIPGYVSQLGQHLDQEQQQMLTELDALAKNVEHIIQIISVQQDVAKSGGLQEELQLQDLLEQSLGINLASLERHHIELKRDYTETAPVLVDKHEVLQILVNLIGNAKQAMMARGDGPHHLTVGIGWADDKADVVRLQVTDNGLGIPPENLTKIFSQGFTTKKEGHGFGLHSSALSAKRLGGSLSVQSKGIGTGATFILDLPVHRETLAA